MPEVSPPAGTYRAHGDSPRPRNLKRALRPHATGYKPGIPDDAKSLTDYQNAIGNPYGLLPRPPQTQAAPFKRLYRK